MYQTGGTIRATLENIQSHQFVLPAIQREFVWSPEQICQFFDSILQGYPFGTFLYWRIQPEHSGKYKFYDFVRDYHQRDNPHCPELGLLPAKSLTAILDGQQRLTALNIGLRGSLALKEPNKWWNNPNAFPKKRLYLNLIAAPSDDEQGCTYNFRFLEVSDASTRNEASGQLWYRVADVLGISSGPEMLKWLQGRSLSEDDMQTAFECLDHLYTAVHKTHCIAYYEETRQELDRVLAIFIRMNSGGTALSYSDLLLSIAVAQWSKRDARTEIHSLVDQLNEVGSRFAFSQDFILKAGLMLTDIGSVGFKVENFNHENMVRLENAWDDVRKALVQSVHLVESFGFDGQTLRADSPLLPIAYYLYKKKAPDNYLTHSSYQDDRETIRRWLVRSLLKASGIWGSGLDTLLTALRSTMQEAGFDMFPIEAIRQTMARRGKSLTFEEEEIEELCSIAYKDRRTFGLLSLLYPFVDLRNQFHIDHVFPISRFTARRLRKAGVDEDLFEEFQEKANQLANLQLLEGAFNNEKRTTLPAEWLSKRFGSSKDREAYCDRHDLGEMPDDILAFSDFFDARHQRLKKRIDELLKLDAS